jgi:hypothetical protein
MQPLPDRWAGATQAPAGLGHAIGSSAATPGRPFATLVPAPLTKDDTPTVTRVDDDVASAGVMAAVRPTSWSDVDGPAILPGGPADKESTPDTNDAERDTPDEFLFARQRARAWFRLGQVALPVRAGAAIVGMVILTASIIMAGTDRHSTMPGPPAVRSAVFHVSTHDMNRLWSGTP